MPLPSSSSPRRRAAAPAAALAVALASAGCADGSSGALEQSDIQVECAPADLACADLGIDRAIAVGASLVLDVAVASPGSSTPALVLRSIDDGVLTVDGTRLTATGPGLTTLLFLAEGSGDVVDFVHVFTAAPDALAVSARGELDDGGRAVEGPIQILVGEALVLTAEPLGGGAVLGGELDADWSVTATPEPDEEGSGEVVTLLETGFGGERRLVARAPGEAQIAIEALGLAAQVTVEVLP